MKEGRKIKYPFGVYKWWVSGPQCWAFSFLWVNARRMLPGKLNFGVCDPGPECHIKRDRVLYKTQIMAVLIPSVPPQRAVTSSAEHKARS